MKFVEQFKYITLHFVTEEGIEYRTSTTGEYWERLYGGSWESVCSYEEETECKKAFAALADVVIAAVKIYI